MTERRASPSAVGSGLRLVAADAAVGWLLYDAVDPRVGLTLWAVAALVVGGMPVDGVGLASRSVPSRSRAGERPLDVPSRE